uniref:RNA helicase n=1 Tax=Prasinoderma singulare TaxID=676789 RepID=A0A7S3FD84_9VIRI
MGATRRVRTALQASPGLQGTPFAARALSSAAEVVLESNTDAALDGVDADAPEGEVMAAAGSAAGSKPPLRPKSHKGLNTVVIDPNDYTAVPFADAGISEELSERLTARGFDGLFPIQAACLEPALSGRDVIARARTGTGKTLAFTIPILQHLLQQDREAGNAPPARGRVPRAAVLCPTRELAQQVQREIEASVPGRFSALCLYGGQSYRESERALRNGVDVIVATPGRLLDQLSKRTVDFSEISHFVLDEADRMLDMGFSDDVENVLSYMDEEKQRQVMLFSATMPPWVRSLADRHTTDAVRIDLVGDSKEKAASTISFKSLAVPEARFARRAKRAVLLNLITTYSDANTIVFVNTKSEADELCNHIGTVVACEALHGDIAQQQREVALEGFRNGRFRVLLATDVAARGLDLPDVNLVVHYDSPSDVESFLHRSGRTGRAGKEGVCIYMYERSNSGRREQQRIVREAGVKFEEIMPPKPEDVALAASAAAANRIEAVDPEAIALFEEHAKAMIEEFGAEGAVQRALAVITGFTEPPKRMSVLSMREEYVAVLVTSSHFRLARQTDVFTVLGDTLERGGLSRTVGDIHLTRDNSLPAPGAVFDLPRDLAEQVMERENKWPNGVEFQLIVDDTNMPQLDFGNDRRGGGRGGGRGRGRGCGRRACAPKAPRRQ